MPAPVPTMVPAPLIHRMRTAARLAAVLAALSPLFLSGCATLSPGGHDRAAAAEPVAQDLRLARAARAAGDFASAVNLYNSALNVRPDDPEILVELGDTLLQIGAVEEAREAYGRVGPDAAARFGAELGLGRAELARHDPEAALGYFAKADELEPGDRRVLLGRGVALDLLKRHPEAQAAYEAVLEADPHDVAARNNLALSLAFARDYEAAEKILTPLARSPKATPRIRQNLALIYALGGDRERALAQSRVDLSAADTEANLAFIDSLMAGN